MLRLVSCEPTGSSFSTPGFAPDSRSHAIALHRTHSGRIAHSFNVIFPRFARSNEVELHAPPIGPIFERP